MNANTIAYCGALPGTAGGASSTAEFQLKDAQATPVVNSVAVNLSSIKNRRFKVRAHGYTTTGASTNLTIILYAGTSTAFASNTSVFNTSTSAVDSEKATWAIEGIFTYDATAAKLQGEASGQINNNTTIARAATTEVASLTITDLIPLVFCVTMTHSSSNAANLSTLKELSVEAL